MKKLIFAKNLIFLQLVIVIYSVAGIAAKKASQTDSIWTLEFFLYYGAEFLILIVYAFLWQQAIKKFQLSVAYANRAMAILWSMVWAVILFKNEITLPNLFGVILIVVGTIVMNCGQVRSDAEEEEKQKALMREEAADEKEEKTGHEEGDPVKEEVCEEGRAK